MHQSSLAHMERFVAEHLTARGHHTSVLDIGSMDVNGTYRALFGSDRFTYTGVDLEPGPNVDVVLDGPYHRLPFGSDRFDVVISGQVLEHVEFPWVAVGEWARVLRPGGLLAIVVPGAGPEHRYPVDCFRYLPDGLAALVRWAGLELVEVVTARGGSTWPDTSEGWSDVVAVGRKPSRWSAGGSVVDAARARALTSPTGAGPRRREIGFAAHETVATWWDEQTRQRTDQETGETAWRAEWQHHPVVMAHVDRRAGGTPVAWASAQLPDPCEELISIGAGAARVELELLVSGRVGRLVLVDVSAGSLDVARRSADAHGVADRVEFVVGPFPDAVAGRPERADAVVFSWSLHHLADVPVVLAATRRLVRPGGVVLGLEYIGPERFAFDASVAARAQDWYRAMDPALRSPWPELPLPDPVDVARADPSEAIDSSRIVEAVRATFPEHHFWMIGGALAHPVWYGLDHGAVYDTDAGRQAVADLLAADEYLTDTGVLPVYFCRFAARV